MTVKRERERETLLRAQNEPQKHNSVSGQKEGGKKGKKSGKRTPSRQPGKRSHRALQCSLRGLLGYRMAN